MRCLLTFLLLVWAGAAQATVAVNETFDGQSATAPLSIYWDGITPTWGTGRSGTGYSVQGDHAQGDVVLQYEDLPTTLDDGVYVRYWVMYASTYHWPGQDSVFDNVKMLKFAGTTGWDMEFIYKDSGAGGPTTLQLYWFRESTGLSDGGTGNGVAALPSFANNVWHKIEVYVHVPAAGNSTVNCTVDGTQVWGSTNADVRRAAADYTGTRQIASIRASNSPAAGEGTHYYDDVCIVTGEGDLTGSTGCGGAAATLRSAPAALNGSLR